MPLNDVYIMLHAPRVSAIFPVMQVYRPGLDFLCGYNEISHKFRFIFGPSSTAVVQCSTPNPLQFLFDMKFNNVY